MLLTTICKNIRKRSNVSFEFKRCSWKQANYTTHCLEVGFNWLEYDIQSGPKSHEICFFKHLLITLVQRLIILNILSMHIYKLFSTDCPVPGSSLEGFNRNLVLSCRNSCLDNLNAIKMASFEWVLKLAGIRPGGCSSIATVLLCHNCNCRYINMSFAVKQEKVFIYSLSGYSSQVAATSFCMQMILSRTYSKVSTMAHQ